MSEGKGGKLSLPRPRHCQQLKIKQPLTLNSSPNTTELWTAFKTLERICGREMLSFNIQITECGRTEINTTKEMSENVVQPGIEPGSPDYRSDALTTRPLNQPRMLRVSFKAL